MTNPEAAPVSSIRAIRLVIPSESLRQFIRSADRLLYEGDFELIEGLEAEAMVFAANGLHSTLYARRAFANHDDNERLRKIANYIEAPWHETLTRVRSRPGGPQVSRRSRRRNVLPAALVEEQGIHVDVNQPLIFRASEIVDSTLVSSVHRGFELALKIDNGPAADVLVGQSDLLNDAAARINAAKLLPRQDETESPIEISFMRAPFKSKVVRDEFMEALKEELPVYDVGLSSAFVYRHEIISV